MCKNTKMDWFVDMYNNNSLDYTIAKTKANFGTVLMPTGTGKSGKVYEDIVYILNHHNAGEKIIINISCPILKLTQQFINDFFAIAEPIFAGNKSFTFFINSSDNGNRYNDACQMMDVDVEYFKDIEKKFINNPYADIAIVASCHKSLYKFINKIDKLDLKNKGINIINYIDEAHLIDIHKDNEDETVVYVDLDKLCKNSTKVYAFTATPDPEVVAKINEYNLRLSGNSKYIYHMRPIEAINKNMILSPLVNYIQTNTDGIVVGMLDKIMKDAKAGNPYINHKILVTLKSAEQLKGMRVELEKLGYTVFSTCSQFGYGNGEDMDDDEKYGDVTEFINDVDTFEGNCFVLHIKQLIQGIDIKSLTDCVIWSANVGSQKHYRHIIQIIGRILRPLAGERGINRENRKKKVGRVYFISPADNEGVQNNIANFICRYYGFDNVTFEVKSYIQGGISAEDLFDNIKDHKIKTGWDNAQIKELVINIENYIKTKIAPKVTLYKKLKKDLDMLAEANTILSKFDAFGNEWNSSELLDNKDLLDKIKELFEKYDIDNCISGQLF